MCGIAGILNLNGEPVSRPILRGMTDAIAHRGPDGEGSYFDGNIGLGHRRLAIIDLTSAGHQPMVTPDGRYALTYNGEIYNFLQLRSELEALGYQFRSRTDSEVVLHAFAAWGPKALNRFNGMFAFAIWDKQERTLLLARDRYGIKPVYYAQRENTFLFGSEIKAIIAHPAYRTELDKEALLEYFTFQNFFTDRTLFKGVRLLPAGTWLRIGDTRPKSSTNERYWDFNFAEPEKIRDEREYIEELDARFQQAVQRQLISDVEVGTYLSGGIDSGSITALAARKIPYVKSFTCGFDLHSASGLELAFDERDSAEYMSYLLKTEHYEMVLKAGDMERVMPRLARHIEEPRVGQSYPNFYAAQLAGKFVKVVLSGAGGDELFGGYPWRYYRAVVNDDFEHYIDKYYAFWNRLIPNTVIQQAFKPIWPEVKHVWTRDIFRDVFTAHASELNTPADYVNHSLYFEAKTFLHGLLVMEDKLSMAHGLETRVPFLDNDLVDFAMRVPVNLKLGNLSAIVELNENEPGPKTERYYRMTHDGKLILRKVLGRYVPPEISKQPKQGFSAPDASWFKGDSIEYVKNVLFDSRARIYNYLDSNTIQPLVKEHISGKVNRRLLIWSLLSFESWCQTFLP
jgi:asparagine synthase (glutamine-hydrolysing)